MRSWFRRRVLPLLAALTLLGAASDLVRPDASAAFSDVPATHWAYSGIQDLYSRGLIQSAKTFRPGEAISKQAFLSLVCRAAGLDDRNLESGAKWAEPAMAYAAYQGWYDEGEEQNRTAPISREFAAKLLVAALFPEEADRQDEGPWYTDEADVGPAYLPYVRAAARLGLIDGYADGSFDPQGTLTRGGAAAVLHRALELQDLPAPGPAVQVPVLMYHDVSYLGYGYSKTPEIFRAQMEELKAAGFHTVFYSQLIDYVDRGTPLPEKPFVLSIDDGYATNYEYIFPILQELDMKAEISLIGGAMQYARWGLRWEQVQEMEESGLVSFQAHTKQMHSDESASGGRKGVLKKPTESWTEYVEALGADTTAILDLIETKTGARPVCFTYPMGKWNAMAEALVTSLGCRVTVTTKDGVASVVQGDPSSLHLMDRIGMDFLNGSVVQVLRKHGYSG